MIVGERVLSLENHVLREADDDCVGYARPRLSDHAPFAAAHGGRLHPKRACSDVDATERPGLPCGSCEPSRAGSFEAACYAARHGLGVVGNSNGLVDPGGFR